MYPKTDKDRWIIAGICGLLFMMMASPFLFQITDRLLSGSMTSHPTVFSLIVHTLLFTLIIRLLMR